MTSARMGEAWVGGEGWRGAASPDGTPYKMQVVRRAIYIWNGLQFAWGTALHVGRKRGRS